MSTAVTVGCGGQSAPALQQQTHTPTPTAGLSHDEYQRAILKIVSGEDSREAGRLFYDVVGKDYDARTCAAHVTGLQQHLEAILDQVEQLAAPADAAAAQHAFLPPARESARLVGVAASDAAAGRLRCGPDMNHRIYGMPSTRRAEAAIADLERAGYLVFGD